MLINIVLNYYRYTNVNDIEYKKLKYFIRGFDDENGTMFLLIQLMPISRIFNKKLVIKYKELTNDFVLSLKQNFENHYKSYDESVIRDFCDALISAKNDALREGKESAPYLTDDNLSFSFS